MRPSAFYIVLCLVIAILAVTGMNPVMPVGFVGSDTYPILLTSRYDDFADMREMIGSKLMPGYFPTDFYRPVSGIIWGGCYRAWGLEARWYLKLNQVLHMLNALLIVPLAILLFGRRGHMIGFAGAAIFALYPLSVDNVPVVARMPDLLCGTLILAALLLHGARGRWRAGQWITPLVSLAAFGVKETAFLLPALLIASDICRGRRWARSVVRAFPSALLLILYLVLRQSVLGGVGGYDAGESPLIRAGETLASYVRTLFVPFGPLETYRSSGVAPFLGRLGAGLLVALLWHRNDPGLPIRRSTGRAALFLGIWVAMVILLHLPVRRFERRYIYLASIPSSLLLAWLMLAGPRGPIARITSAAAAFLIVWQLSFTPGFGGYQEWRVGDRLAHEFLCGVDSEIAGAMPDRPLAFLDTPWKVIARPKRVPYVDQAFILSERSVKGYAALRHPTYRGELTVRARKVYMDPHGNTTF